MTWLDSLNTFVGQYWWILLIVLVVLSALYWGVRSGGSLNVFFSGLGTGVGEFLRQIFDGVGDALQERVVKGIAWAMLFFVVVPIGIAYIVHMIDPSQPFEIWYVYSQLFEMLDGI